MKIKRIFVLVAFLLITTFPINESLLSSEIEWTHAYEFESGFQVKWDSEDPDFLTMEISAMTNGYVSIGFSHSGNMLDSDIVAAWVDSNGIPHLKDFHGVGQVDPVLDLQQDYFIVAASERDNKTTVRFHRRWETCDELHDLSIGTDTMMLIWAWSTEDPSFSEDYAYFPYHGPETRGSFSARMRLPFRPLPFPPLSGGSAESDDQQVWDLVMENVDIDEPIRNSVHMCRIIEFPFTRGRYQLTGFRPLITVENQELIYRISLHHCKNVKQARKEASECFEFDELKCHELVLAWGYGSEGEMFPAHVGQGIPDPSTLKHFMLQVHYDNLRGKQVLDSSGIRLFLTRDERLFDSSILRIGHKMSPFLAIPPSQESFKIYSICSSDCTRSGIPESGINIFSVMLSSHETGRKVRLRHIRKGKELAPIAEDGNYTHKFQQNIIMRHELRIFPGDELLLECEYDTSHRDKFTFGGYTNEMEMCEGLIYYYPKTKLTLCESKPEYQSFFAGFGIRNVMGEGLMRVDRHSHEDGADDLFPPQFALERWSTAHEDTTVSNPFDSVFINMPPSLHNISVTRRMESFDWRLKHVSRNLENNWRNGKYYMNCDGPWKSKDFRHIAQIPKLQRHKKSTHTICRRTRKSFHENSAGRTNSNYTEVIVISFAVLSKVIFDVRWVFGW